MPLAQPTMTTPVVSMDGGPRSPAAVKDQAIVPAAVGIAIRTELTGAKTLPCPTANEFVTVAERAHTTAPVAAVRAYNFVEAAAKTMPSADAGLPLLQPLPVPANCHAAAPVSPRRAYTLFASWKITKSPLMMGETKTPEAAAEKDQTRAPVSCRRARKAPVMLPT